MSKYNDFDWVFSYDHLLKSADLCKRNVYWKASVQNFMFEKDFNVSVIHNELMENRFRVKHKHKFSLYERGKKRIIQSGGEVYQTQTPINTLNNISDNLNSNNNESNSNYIIVRAHVYNYFI